MDKKRDLSLDDFELQGNMYVPKGQKIIVKPNGWMQIIDKDIEDLSLNDYCYFCDYNETTPHMHHIIRRAEKGKDDLSNLIPLCANHHEQIHKKKVRVIFSKGFFYLINNKTNQVTKPTKRQQTKVREFPFSSVVDNQNLIVEGDLNNKASINIIPKKMRGLQ